MRSMLSANWCSICSNRMDGDANSPNRTEAIEFLEIRVTCDLPSPKSKDLQSAHSDAL